MNNIFVGFMFLFFDFDLNLNEMKIGLIPDFVGYIIMAKGLLEMADKSPLFLKVRPYASGMALYTAILYIMDLFNISTALGGMTYLLAIISIVISLYISYHIVMGVLDLEKSFGMNLSGDILKSIWYIHAGVTIMTYLTIIIPVFLLLFIFVSFIVSIIFLVMFNQSKNQYYRYQ